MEDFQHEKEDDKNELFRREFMNSLSSTPGFISSLNYPFEDLATVASSSSASSLLHTSCFPVNNKRVFGDHDNNMINGGDSRVDRRHKRMMKNRESAARSRARRQAYTSELEREHAELKEENAKLRKQHEMLLLTLPTYVPRNSCHSRSSTAPF